MKYSLFFFTILLFACPRLDQEASKPTEDESLVGKWRWVSSSFMTRGMSKPKITTPESVGYSMTAHFKNDGELDILHKENISWTYNYQLQDMNTPVEELLVLKMKPQASMPDPSAFVDIASGPLYIKGDTLHITGGYNDAGENQLYVKIK